MLPKSSWRKRIEPLLSRHGKIICSTCALYLIYLVTAYPIMRWFGQWPAPIWFSYGLSAIFIAFNFGVSLPRKITLILLSSLAAIAQWSQGLTWKYDISAVTDNAYFRVFSPYFLERVFGALALTLFLLAALVPQRPNLSLIVGLIVFVNLQNLLAGFGMFVAYGLGNYDEYGYASGQYSLFATVVVSLIFRCIARDKAEH